jgi:hypothetical protein
MKHLFTFSSNSVRLSLRNWVFVLVILLLVLSLLPIYWKLVEKFDPSDNYRIPYELSSDYWMFSRWSKYASSNYRVLMIGDSVVWGQYVKMNETLPYYLNKYMDGSINDSQESSLTFFPKGNAKTPIFELGSNQVFLSDNGINGNFRANVFTNLGMDGVHPTAMLGLIKYYGKSISNKGIILHLNPLWMSSKKHDLSDTDEFRFNHPRLVPQFYPKIASYKAKFPQRFGIVVERSIPFTSWVNHVRSNYYENMDIGNWSMQYPYENPISAINFQIPLPENKSHSEPIGWMERGMTKQDFPWVSADESFQWNSFKKVINLLQARKNKVFVIIGPFNPYILTDESLNRYKTMKKDMEEWLKNNGINYIAISDLPSEYYTDASHPLKEGYAAIAKELMETELFRNWLVK